VTPSDAGSGRTASRLPRAKGTITRVHRGSRRLAATKPAFLLRTRIAPSLASTTRSDGIASFADLMASAPVAAFAKDAGGKYVYANPHLLATMGAFMGSDWYGKTDADMWPPEAAETIRVHDEAALSGAGAQVFSYSMKAGDRPHTVLLIEFALPAADQGAGIGGFAVDITASAIAQDEHDRLVAAVEHAADAILTIGLDGQIRDTNSALERISGYSRDEMVGQTPALFKSGIHPEAFYDDMRATMAAGLEWSGEMVGRRKDGSFFTATTVISPVLSVSGTITGYVSVSSDVTAHKALAARSASSTAQWNLVLEGIRGHVPDTSLEAKAQAICLKAASLTGIAAAQIVVFQPDGQALPIGHAVAGREDPPLCLLSFQISRRLRTRAALAAWTEPWENRQGRAYNQLVQHAGPSALAYAPVCSGGRLVGLLTVQSIDVANKDAVDELLPVIVDFASVAGAILGPELAERIDAQSGREYVANIITRHAFRPVFQPIVDIVLDKVVGYEALTRFADGSDPEAVFAAAAAAHLGVELEIATLKAALTASKRLPSHTWLNVNASPDFVRAGGLLRFLLSETRRPIVVEVTEHTAIVDYPAFRAAVAALKPGTRLAVDDAGAGFAGLRHILELRPDFVKLDRWLVAGLEKDEARQAMIVGLRHFARKTGCLLIAEGIETDREIAVLRSLDIHLGQGYALGRPRAVDASPVPASEIIEVA
jgi:PAS domain S-box-containing protein